MTIQLIKTKHRELFKVNRQVFTDGNIFNHLKNKIFGLTPKSTSINIHRGKHMGEVISYEVKGVLPKYGDTMSNMINLKQKEQIYAKFS